MDKTKSAKHTLLMSVLMSAPGPLIIALGLKSSGSATQLADFFRRSTELLAIISSYIVYLITNGKQTFTQAKKQIAERNSNIFVGIVMCLSGAIMLYIALFMTSTNKGNVLSGLAIAFLGAVANSIFWIKYKKLAQSTDNAILSVQSSLYKAKALVDICVCMTLFTIWIFPDSKISLYLDIISSIIVSLYIIKCGFNTLKKSIIR